MSRGRRIIQSTLQVEWPQLTNVDTSVLDQQGGLTNCDTTAHTEQHRTFIRQENLTNLADIKENIFLSQAGSGKFFNYIFIMNLIYIVGHCFGN